MSKSEQQQQEPVRSVKATRSVPVRTEAAKLPDSPARGAGKWALGVPLGDLSEAELIEMASALGNSAMYALMRGEGIETVGPYRFASGSFGGIGDFAASVNSGGGEANEIAPAAPALMDSFSFGHISGPQAPFAADAILSRSEGASGVNIFAESFGGAP